MTIAISMSSALICRSTSNPESRPQRSSSSQLPLNHQHIINLMLTNIQPICKWGDHRRRLRGDGVQRREFQSEGTAGPDEGRVHTPGISQLFPDRTDRGEGL